MPFNIGTSAAKKVYWGTTEIKKIFSGTTQVWASDDEFIYAVIYAAATNSDYPNIIKYNKNTMTIEQTYIPSVNLYTTSGIIVDDKYVYLSTTNSGWSPIVLVLNKADLTEAATIALVGGSGRLMQDEDYVYSLASYVNKISKASLTLVANGSNCAQPTIYDEPYIDSTYIFTSSNQNIMRRITKSTLAISTKTFDGEIIGFSGDSTYVYALDKYNYKIAKIRKSDLVYLQASTDTVYAIPFYMDSNYIYGKYVFDYGKISVDIYMISLSTLNTSYGKRLTQPTENSSEKGHAIIGNDLFHIRDEASTQGTFNKNRYVTRRSLFDEEINGGDLKAFSVVEPLIEGKTTYFRGTATLIDDSYIYATFINQTDSKSYIKKISLSTKAIVATAQLPNYLAWEHMEQDSSYLYYSDNNTIWKIAKSNLAIAITKSVSFGHPSIALRAYGGYIFAWPYGEAIRKLDSSLNVVATSSEAVYGLNPDNFIATPNHVIAGNEESCSVFNIYNMSKATTIYGIGLEKDDNYIYSVSSNKSSNSMAYYRYDIATAGNQTIDSSNAETIAYRGYSFIFNNKYYVIPNQVSSYPLSCRVAIIPLTNYPTNAIANSTKLFYKYLMNTQDVRIVKNNSNMYLISSGGNTLSVYTMKDDFTSFMTGQSLPIPYNNTTQMYLNGFSE